MAKIRGIKPDLWTDEDFVELSPFARLLWLGLWNYSCDNGHVADKPKQIKMRVLPTDDVNCSELLRELESQGLIERADGWITTPNLTHHQRPDRRYFTTCEKDGCDAPPETLSQRESRRVHAVQTKGTPRAHVGGTPSARVDGELKGSDGDSETTSRVRGGATAPDLFPEFWDAYPRKVAKAGAQRAWVRAAKKADPAVILAGLRRHLPVWAKGDPKFIPHAATWLNDERWSDDLGVTRPRDSRPEGW